MADGDKRKDIAKIVGRRVGDAVENAKQSWMKSSTKQPPTSPEDVAKKEIVIGLIKEIADHIHNTAAIQNKIRDAYARDISSDDKEKFKDTLINLTKSTSVGGAANHEEGLHSLEEPISSIKKPKKKPQK
jgi:hypothetical protein